MRNVLQSLDDGLARLSLLLSGLCLVLIVALIFIEGMSRYVFDFPFGVSDEFSGYLLVGMIFLGLAYAARNDAHIKVQIFITRVPPSTALLLRGVSLILFFLFSAAMTKLAYDYTIVNYVRGTRSFFVWLTPQWIVMMPMAIGFFLLSLTLILRFVRLVRVRRGDS